MSSRDYFSRNPPLELRYDRHPEYILDAWRYILSGAARKEEKNFYRGGMAVSRPYFFPLRRVIEKTLIQHGGEELLGLFNHSPFGSNFIGGSERSSGQTHKVSATSLVTGWRHNQDFWNKHMISDGRYGKGQTYHLKELPIEASYLSVPASLFVTPDNLFPFEVQQEYFGMADRGGRVYEFVASLINETGLTPNEFGRGLQLCNYSIPFLSNNHLAVTYSTKTTLDATTEMLHDTVRLSEAWGWACLGHRMEWDSDAICEVVARALGKSYSLDQYAQYALAGVSPDLIESAIEHDIDLDLALHL
jgi:hypothetical protein